MLVAAMNAALKLGIVPRQRAAATIQQIEKLGGTRLWRRTVRPSGRWCGCMPPQNWTALATLPGVQIVEPIVRAFTPMI